MRQIGIILGFASYAMSLEIQPGSRFERVQLDSTTTVPPTDLIWEGNLSNLHFCSAKCLTWTGRDCWGFEYNIETKNCKVIEGTSPTSYLSLTSTALTGSRLYWSTPDFNKCGAPMEYNEYTTTTYADPPKAYGTSLSAKCKTGSAFNSAQLASSNYPTTHDTNGLFKSIPITCGRLGLWYPRRGSLPECQTFVECLRTIRGNEFQGNTYSTTASGAACINWSAQTYETGWVTDPKAFPTGTLADQGNYCRNPTYTSRNKPWCFVADSAVKWEYCNIPACLDPAVSSLNCKLDAEGSVYLGTVAVTSSSKACVPWSPSPSRASGLLNYMPDDDAPGYTSYPANNYCRNPKKEYAGPWCWYFGPMSVPHYELCSVPTCP